MSDFAFDYTELYLATPYTAGDLTLDVYAKNDTYKLTDHKTSALITEFYSAGIDRDDETKFMGMKFSNTVTNGTWQGATRYTVTLATSDGANPMVALANSYDGTTADANIINSLKLSSLKTDSLLLCSVGSGVFRKLSGDFASATTSETITLGSGEAFAIRSQLSLHTDGAYYKYHKINYPNWAGTAGSATSGVGESFTLRRPGYRVPGYSSLTIGAVQYAENTGATTETSSTTTTPIGKAFSATEIDLIYSLPGVVEAGKVEAEAGTIQGKYMSPLRTKQAIDVQVPVFLGAYADFFGDSVTDLVVDGTTELALDTIHEYRDITIENGGILTTAGTDGILILKCRNLDVQTGGIIDLSGKGGIGGVGVNENNDSGEITGEADGNDGVSVAKANYIIGASDGGNKGKAEAHRSAADEYSSASGGSGGGSKSASTASSVAQDAAAASGASAISTSDFEAKWIQVFVGSGGASGGAAISTNGQYSGDIQATSTDGGTGGAGLIVFASGTVNIDGYITCDGTDGGDATTSVGSINKACSSAGGSGGGGGGSVFMLHKGAFTGTIGNITVAGGSGGSNSNSNYGTVVHPSSSAGTAGGAGFVLVQRLPF